VAEYKIVSILWKQNSPYGTYNSGDAVEVFWSDVTNGFKVYKNGVGITSGNNIPVAFIHNNQYSQFYKTESIEQVSICLGTSKVKYERDSVFPYLKYTLLQDHPTCNIPVVCDLQFSNLPVVTNATSAIALNGSVSVSATSSNGPIQYLLNRDFAYGYGQTSTTFSNLAPGTYTVYARDKVNCRATITFNVGINYSYGTKYRCEYKTPLGDIHKTEVKEKGYAGTINDVEGGIPVASYRLRGESERDKFVPILAGEIETTFISEIDNFFDSIYTNDPEKYRLVHSINGTAVWTGKVLTNQFEESYTSAPYPVTIVASDTLPQLEQIPFLDDYGNRLYGDIKQIVLIAYILKKLNLGLSIRSALNIYASSMNKAAADDPLDQAYVDVSRYYQLQDNPSCADVLKWILEPYNAQILQWNNVWNIIRVEERINSFDYRQYDSNGVYVSNSTYNPVKDLKLGSSTNRMVWANQNQRMRIMPGYGSIRTLYNLGNRKNIFKNGDFKLTSRLNYDAFIGDESIQLVPDLNGFEIINEPNKPVNLSYEDLGNNNIAVTFTSFSTTGLDYLLSDSLNLKMGTIDKLRINFRFKVSRSKLDDPNILYDFRYLRVRFKIQYGDYFLNNEGFWTTTDAPIIYYVEKDKANEFISYETVCSAPIDPVTLTPKVDFVNGESFQIKIYFPNANEVEFKENTTAAAIDRLKARATVNLPVGIRTELYDSTGTYTPAGFLGNYILYYELKEDKNDQTLPDIVRPTDYNSTTNPVQWILQGIQKYDESIKVNLAIDKIVAEILGEGKPLPDYETLEQDMENDNPTPIQKEIVHGSLGALGKTLPSFGIGLDFGDSFFSVNGLNPYSTNVWQFKIDYVANSSDLSYNGYLRNSSGVGYDKWERSAFAESKTLQEIFMNSYSSQYNRPWRMLIGNMYSNDTFFAPIDILNETMDDNRKYLPISLVIDFYANTYECEFLELFDITENSAVGFTKGFSIGFNS